MLPDLKSMDTPRICLWVAGFGLGTTGLLVATRPSRHGGEPLDVRLTRLLVRIATVIAIPFVLVPLHLMQGFRRPTGWLDTYFNLAFYCSIWASALLFLYAGQIAWRAGRRVTAVEAFAVFVLASIVWTLVSMETGIEVLMGVGGRVSEIINALPISGVLLTATLASDLVNMPGGFAADLRRGVILLASCWSLLVLVHLALMPGRRMDAADDVERTMGDQ
ncbi:MAG TPA: hypothetical protein VGN72_02520 [Tepidisphaeraceae bacterium]|nr:hypothetical protein [Tepidisphaeraceae bacterium]